MNEAAEMSPGWHLDKRVSVGHLVTTLVVLMSVFWWGAKLQEKQSINDIRITNNEKAIQALRQSIETQNGEIIRRLEGIDSKMDRHLESHSRNNR